MNNMPPIHVPHDLRISQVHRCKDDHFHVAIDDNSRLLFINLRRVVLHRMSFKKPISAVFSPNESLVAVKVGKLVQIWRAPGFKKEFFPFQLVRNFADCEGAAMSVDWSPDSKYLLVGSKDLAARLFCSEKFSGVSS